MLYKHVDKELAFPGIPESLKGFSSKVVFLIETVPCK